MKLFNDGMERSDFYREVSEGFYAETQEGFDFLASDIVQMIDSHFRVALAYLRESEKLKIYVSYVGCLGFVERSYCTCIQHNDLYSDLSRIEDILTAFACGLGYDC